MSITDKLNDLKIVKQDIKSAIQEKGVTPTGGLSTYADAIRNIQTGGGSGTVGLPVGTKFGYSEFTNAPFFDTSGLTDMSMMFYNCNQMTTVPLYDTGNVTNMSSMFNLCQNLKTIPLFDTSKVTNTTGMFENCNDLISIPQLDTSKLIFMQSMFNNCYNLEEIPLLDTSSVYKLTGAFNNCIKLTNLGGFKNLKHSLNLGNCINLTRESLINVINNLAVVKTEEKLTITTSSYNKLSDDDIKILTDKGWTLSISSYTGQ